MKSCILVVRSRPVAGMEAEFNRWYTEQHLPDVLKVPGFISARRYRTAHPGADGHWEYLAVYEFEAVDPDEAIAALKARARTPEMMLSEAMDFSRYALEPWVAVCDRQVAAAPDQSV